MSQGSGFRAVADNTLLGAWQGTEPALAAPRALGSNSGTLGAGWQGRQPGLGAAKGSSIPRPA